MINDYQKHEIKSHALSNLKEECCGLILKNGSVVRCQNVAENKQDSFRISPQDIIKYSKEILYIYHSHFDRDNFSFLDKLSCFDCGYSYYLYDISSNSFLFRDCNLNIDYIGRTFIWGKKDCLNLVQDYYKNELDIEIGAFKDSFFSTRDLLSLRKGYRDKIDEHGFALVEDFKENDLIVFYEGDKEKPTHIAIYLGNNKILHQIKNKPSCVNDLDNEQISKICCILRHKCLI